MPGSSRITTTSAGGRFRRAALEYPVLWLSLIAFLAVLPIRPEIAGLANLELVLLATVLLTSLALGQTMVMITGGIDLSLPAVISLTSVVGASLMAEGTPLAGSAVGVVAAVVVMLALGAAVGAAQGAAIAVFRMPAFLVSLAALMFLGGVAVWYTQSERIAVPIAFTELWYGRWLGIPLPVFIVAIAASFAHLTLAQTVVGRWIYALGHNRRAAEIAGVPVVRATIFAYLASGLSAGLASVLYTARLYTGSPQLVETEVLLDCIGGVVIGGTSIFGGRGRVTGTILGVFFIALVGDCLNMLGLRYWHVITVKGGVILLAALLDAARNRYLAR
jgi:ribose/xylose/arabinose/galactoside ABC-type transport system permease subunit